MPITADEAQQIIAQDARYRDRGKRMLPPILDRIRVLQKEETFSICNVGPWPYLIERGCRHIMVPAYDPAKDEKKLGYAASAPLPSIHREAKIISEDEFGWFEEDGRTTALDMIGVGFGLSKQFSLVQYGVFVPAGAKPTKEEIVAAQKELSAYYDRLIEEARDAYDKGPDERKNVIDPDRHLRAARVRGIQEKWVTHAHAEESVRCESCGRFNPPNIANCQCGVIINFELAKQVALKQARMKQEIAALNK